MKYNYTFNFIKVKEPTKTIVLNAVDLSISSASIKFDAPTFIASIIDFCPDEEKVTLTFDKDLLVGSSVLNISFSGKLNDKMKGFYRSKYYTKEGEERYGAVTQL